MEILPVLDDSVLKEKANEFAMKGAIDTIKEYYSGYNSPFKKAIEEELKKKGVSHSLDLPDIIGLINDSISSEIDQIVNTSIANTFIPQAKRLLTRENPEVNFSDILREFIKSRSSKDIDDFTCYIDESDTYGYLSVELKGDGRDVKISLACQYETRKGPKKDKRYTLFALPYEKGNSYEKKMKLTMDGGGSLELPMTTDVLRDNFNSYVARLVICKSVITMDVEDFDEDMIERDGCECH